MCFSSIYDIIIIEIIIRIREESRLNQITGKKVPDFHLKAVSGDGGGFIDVNLDTYKGHWLVLFFYPMNFTFVCPTGPTPFGNDLRLFEDADARPLAISTNSEYTHRAWIRNGLGRVGYPLGVDKTLPTPAGYGVLLGDQSVALRSLFIIDPNRVIRYNIVRDNNIGKNTQEALRVLKVLQTSSFCGISWTVGSQPPREDSNVLLDAFSIGQAARTYALLGCSYYRQIKKFLSDNGVSFEEINLENDAKGQAFMDSRGYTALPVTVIGSNGIPRFRPDKIKELLL